MSGLGPSGSNSLGTTRVRGSIRVPNPAQGITATFTGTRSSCLPLLEGNNWGYRSFLCVVAALARSVAP